MFPPPETFEHLPKWQSEYYHSPICWIEVNNSCKNTLQFGEQGKPWFYSRNADLECVRNVCQQRNEWLREEEVRKDRRRVRVLHTNTNRTAGNSGLVLISTHVQRTSEYHYLCHRLTLQIPNSNRFIANIIGNYRKLYR